MDIENMWFYKIGILKIKTAQGFDFKSFGLFLIHIVNKTNFIECIVIYV